MTSDAAAPKGLMIFKVMKMPHVTNLPLTYSLVGGGGRSWDGSSNDPIRVPNPMDPMTLAVMQEQYLDAYEAHSRACALNASHGKSATFFVQASLIR